MDNDIPSFTFKTAAITINEDTGTVQIPVILSNPSILPVTIRYSVEASGTTALKGTDYNLSSSDSITFASKDTIAYLSCTILKDNTDGSDKTLSLRVYPADQKTLAGAITSCVLTIKDIDSSPSISFVKDTASIGEGDGAIEVPVTYTGKSQKTLSVNYQISANSTGCDTSDYTLNGTGIITFGTASEGKISITIKDDNIPDDGEWLELSLYNPQNISNGTLMKERVFIRDNDHLINISSLGDSGSVVPAGASVVKHGSNLRIIATPKSHYHFIKWSADNNLTIDDPLNDTTRLLNISSNGNVTALFAIDTYSVIVTASENGSITPSGTVNVPYGKFPAISLTALNGYHFSHWEISENVVITGDLTDPTSTFTINGNGSIKSICSINGFTVIINSNDATLGTVTPSGVLDATYGSNLILTVAAVTSAHSHFLRWTATGGLTSASLTSTTLLTTTLQSITTSGTVTALFGLDTSSIQIASTDTLKGTVDPSTTILKPFGDTIPIKATSKTGYHFGSWSITDGTTNVTIASLTDSQTVIKGIKGNASVVANFIINSYPIRITSGANGTVLDTGTHMVNYNGTYTLQVNQPSAGYKFKNWSIAQGASNAVNIVGQYNATTTINQIHGPATLQANFELKSYTLKFIATASEGTVQPDSQTGILHGVSTLINATATPLNSSKYSWNNRWAVTGDNATLSNGNIILTGDATIRAVFDIKQYPLTLIKPDSGGSIASSPIPGTYEYDSQIILTATDSTGWQFDHWTGVPAGGQAKNPDTIKVSTTNTISAVFARRTYTLTLTSDPLEGTVTPGTLQFLYNVPTTFSPTVVPSNSSKYVFANSWEQSSGVSINSNIVTLTNDATIRAKFNIRTYPLTITTPPSSGGGTISSDLTNGQSYAFGTSVTLTPHAVTGWHFVNWTDDNTGSANPLITTIGASNSYSAVFVKNRYTITIPTFSPGSPGRITISPSSVDSKYDFGTSVTVSAIAELGYTWSSWSGISGTTNSITFGVAGDMLIDANFSENSVPGGVICVWPNSPSASKNGSNWAHAYTTIYDAIANSSDSSEIWVTQGTYSANGASYVPRTGTKTYGGFIGGESLLSQRNWQTHPTILDGQASNTTAFDIANSGVVLNGLTIANYTGIAVNCSGNNTQIINCCIKNNTGANAVYLRSTGNTVSNCIFKSNGLTSSSTFGRALYLSSASNNNTISNSLFFQNAGPAIRDDNTNKSLASKINSCTIVKNGSSSISFPGGLKAKGATVLNGDIIYYNTNTGTSKYGRQIDSTYGVTSCGIQIADSKDTSGCGDLLNWATVITADPAFIANIPNSDLTTLADSTWYSTVTTSIPLLLNSSTSPLLNKYYGGAPSLDIRGVSRNSKIDIGAYESANPNQ